MLIACLQKKMTSLLMNDTTIIHATSKIARISYSSQYAFTPRTEINLLAILWLFCSCRYCTFQSVPSYEQKWVQGWCMMNESDDWEEYIWEKYK